MVVQQNARMLVPLRIRASARNEPHQCQGAQDSPSTSQFPKGSVQKQSEVRPSLL